MLESKELLEKSIKEFENEKNQEKEHTKANMAGKIHTTEEFHQLLNDLRRDLNK